MRNELNVRAMLSKLFIATVEVAEFRDTFDDRLTIESK
jgi:hypothetical protein